MHFLPILSTLRRHRTASALIVLEIAFTCAIVCNAVFLIRDRIDRVSRPSGLAEDELVFVQVTGLGTRTDAAAVTAQDLAALRAIPGVTSTATVNMIPFGRSSWSTSISTKPEDPNAPAEAALYMGTPDLIETTGLEITAGRDFTPDEYVAIDDLQKDKATISSVIVSRCVADLLYPGKNPIGQPVYVSGKDPQVIVGLFEHITTDGSVNRGCAVIIPANVAFNSGSYLLRVDPARKADVLAQTEPVMKKIDSRRIFLDNKAYSDLRSDFYRADRAMAWLLAGVSIALLVITALGVVGLASFWVQQRTRQIGIRRALGATRGDILRYFQAENFILATLGIVLGMVLAYGLNLWFMGKFGVERLPAGYLPIGAALLWGLGQIAVLGPALRASLIPPAIATRSV